jgi:hypothetical protein
LKWNAAIGKEPRDFGAVHRGAQKCMMETRLPRNPADHMRRVQCSPERASGVSCRGLHEDRVERSFTKNPQIRDTVERNAASQREIP